jgi:hypothetical protein
MQWFDPRAHGRAPSSGRGKLLILGASLAVLAGLTVMVTGGFAQSSDGSQGASAAAKKRTFLRACVQRHDVKHSQGDLNVLKSECAEGQRPLRLALWPVKRKAGKQGAQGPAGPQGAQGPAGPQGPAGAAAPTPEYGVASVFVSRGGGNPSRFATYSAQLGSPAGTSTGGDFRFTCTPAQAPCKVSWGAAVITTRTGNASVYPRLLIHKQADLANAPMTFCEYADGATNGAGVAPASRVPSLAAALTAMQTPRSMGIGSSLDCGSSQTFSPEVTEIWVPAASAVDTAFYDVSATFTFG